MKIILSIAYGVATLIWLFTFIVYLINGTLPNPINLGLSFFLTTLAFLRWFVLSIENKTKEIK